MSDETAHATVGWLELNDPSLLNGKPVPVPLPLPPLPPASMLPAQSLGWDPSVLYWPPPVWYRPAPRVWPVFVAYVLAFVAAQMAGAMVLVGAVLAQHLNEIDSPQQAVGLIQEVVLQPGVLLGMLIAIQAALTCAALFGAGLSPQPLLRRLRLGRSTMHAAGYPLVMLGAIAIGVLFTTLIQLLHIKEAGSLKMLADVFRHLSTPLVVATVLVVGGGPAIGEEWLCRGYMQTRLSLRFGRWPAIWITAALFGLMHLPNFAQSVFAFILGIYLGYIAEKTGSVRPTMACHVANNGAQVLVARYLSDWAPSASAGLALLGGSALFLVLSIAYVCFGVRAAPPPEPATEPIPSLLPYIVPGAQA